MHSCSPEVQASLENGIFEHAAVGRLMDVFVARRAEFSRPPLTRRNSKCDGKSVHTSWTSHAISVFQEKSALEKTICNTHLQINDARTKMSIHMACHTHGMSTHGTRVHIYLHD